MLLAVVLAVGAADAAAATAVVAVAAGVILRIWFCSASSVGLCR